MISPRASTPRGISRLTFGMVPFMDNERARLQLADFCAAVGRAIGTQLLPHIAPSPAALASAIASGRVQVAWLSPTLLVSSRNVADVVPLASSVREGVASYHAALFVSDRSSRRTLESLRGTRAAWVAASSGSGYLFPRISMAQQGFDPATMFASDTFYNSHGAVAAAVLDAEAEVGATFVVFEGGDPAQPLARAGFQNVRAGRTGVAVDIAGPIPSDVIVAAPAVPHATRAAMASALVGLSGDAAAQVTVKSLFGVDGFEAFSSASLQVLRALIATGRKLGVVADATP